MTPVLKGFKIAAQNGKNVVIDVTAFFGANEKAISPIKTDNPLSKLLGGANSLKGTFVPDRQLEMFPGKHRNQEPSFIHPHPARPTLLGHHAPFALRIA